MIYNQSCSTAQLPSEYRENTVYVMNVNGEACFNWALYYNKTETSFIAV